MPGVLPMALSKSFPTPKTSEFARVVTSDTVGAPFDALAVAVAPIAPDPFIPDVSTPFNATTVIEETTDCDKVAETVTPLSALAAKARQISDEPRCAFALTTS